VKQSLRWFVRLFPAEFRGEFGADMAEQLAIDFDRARSRGRRAALWFWMRSAVNVTGAALAERGRPSSFLSAGTPTGFLQEHPMRRFIDGWRQDLKHAARALRRSPGFAGVTIGTLALAIGITVALFAVVNAVLLTPLPYGDEKRLMFITAEAPGSDIRGEMGVGDEFVVHFLERSKLLEDFGTFGSFTNTMRTNDRVERIRMSSVTPSIFTTLSARPALGRLPVKADGDNVAVISDTLWSTWFGRDPSVLNRTYAIGGANRMIIGVLGPEFRFPTDTTLVWIPYNINAAELQLGQFGSPAIARVKPGVTPEQAARELTALSKELPGRFGGTARFASLIGQLRILSVPLADRLVDGAAQPLWVLFGGAAIVLLIACANVANLFLVRSEGRLREMAVRQAVGAERSQLLRVQLSESLIIAAVAGAIAVLLARVSLPLLLRAVPGDVPRISNAAIGLDAMLFAVAMSFFAAIACGLVPALRASKPTLSWLREGARGSTRRRGWGRDALVAAQTALALVLLIGSGLLMRSYTKLSTVDRGYETKDIFTFQFAPEQPALRNGPAYARFAIDFMERVQTLPNVQAVGLVENVPIDEGTAAGRFLTDATAANPDSAVRLNVTFSGGDHFKVMGTRVLAGTPFTNDDATGMLGHAIVSKSAAAALWPGQNPIGQRLQRVGWQTWETVIGVVEDVKQNNFRDPPQSTVYFPMSGHTPEQWRLSSPGFVVKTTRADSIEPDIRAIIKQVAPEAPMYRIYTMEGLARRTMGALSFTMLALGLVSSMALILGALGLYGVLSYVVAERTQEIGVRMALGAQPSGVRWMVVGQGLKVVFAGIVIGVAVAYAASSSLSSLLFGVAPVDAATFAATSAVMLIVGALSSYLPARRASAVDPIQSLR
jgi:putative ABC transport system permease protein